MTLPAKGLTRLVLLAWGLIALFLLIADAHSIAVQRFPDPDDTLRLQQVRDLLQGQNWFDLHQHRLDPHDGGVPMHWSRLVDMPLAGLILLLRPLLGGSLAEQVTMVVVPLLTLLAVVGLVARLAWHWLGPKAAACACLLVGLAGPLVSQLQPRRIDHHGWQVVTALLAMNGLMMRDARRGGWLAGLSLAAGLTISLESLPVTAGFALAGAWRWLRGGENRLWLAHFMAALATATLAFFAATRGFGDMAMHCDQISPVHLAVFIWGGVVLAALARARGWPLWAQMAALALTGMVALALYGELAPQCRHGAFDMLTPRLRSIWYDNVGEGLPFWRQSLPDAVQMIVTPLAALLAALWVAWRGARMDRAFWGDYALVLAVAIAVALMVQRASAMSFALAAVPLGGALVEGWQAVRHSPQAWQRLGLTLLMVLVVVPTMPLTLLTGPAQPGKASVTTSGAPWGADVGTCPIPTGSRALAQAPRGLVMAPLDLGPALLLATPQAVLASGHHRGARAMDATLAAFTAPDDQAHAIVRHEGVTYVALCQNLLEPHMYGDVGPDGLAAHLLAGHAPNWLAPMPAPLPLRLWRVEN